jgi:glucokinase
VGDWVLGLDIGGTKTAFVLADTRGEIVARARRPTVLCGDPRTDVQDMARAGLALLDEVGAGPGDLAGAGAAVPGPIDFGAGVLQHPPNMPGWESVPVRDWLSEALGCPVALENDANAAALAEHRFGAGRGHDDVIYLTMSTGVGGGIVAGGRILRGEGGGAGEIGHTPVEWGGEACGCGMRGCLEAYVGGACLTRRLARVTPPDSEVARLAGGADLARPEHLVEAARGGCAFALAEMERFTDYLARGIVPLAFTLDPGVIVLGTICVAAGEALCFDPLRRKARERLWPDFAERLRVVPAELGAELPYRAAVCAALGSLEPEPLTPGG